MKITNLKQMFPETPEGASGVAVVETHVATNVVEQTPQESNFSSLVSAFKDDVQAAVKEENTPKNEDGTPKESTEPVIAEKKEGEIVVPEVKKEETKAEEPVLDFKIPGADNTPPTTWETLKADFNLDVKEEKPEAYKEAINKLIETKAEEVRSQSLDKLMEKESIEVQEKYLFAKNGDAIAINGQLATISAFKNLDNVSLVEQDLRLKGFDPEAIETKMALLVENNQIDATAEPLRKLLNEAEQTTLAEKTAFVQSLREKQQNSAIQQKENLATGTADYFKTFKEFMGTPVNDKTKENMQQYIVNGVKEGKYSNVLKPTELAEWILYKEFGNQAVSNVKTKAFAEGRDTKTKDLHNVPPKQNGINSVPGNHIKNDGAFSNLRNEFGPIS